MKALILAGGLIQSNDPLCTYQEFGTKSQIPLLGKPMVQWVIDALSNSKKIDELLIVGLNKDTQIKSLLPTQYLPDQGSLFENIIYGSDFIRGLEQKDQTFLLVSGDIPGLTPEMIDWLIDHVDSENYELYYSVIPRDIMEKTFPGSKRSFIKFKDIQVCGGDINVINTRLMNKAGKLWEKLTDARKSAKKQASLIGLDTLFLLALRLITLDQTAERICKKLHIVGKALPVPFAEMGMDVDKPHQLILMVNYLKTRKI